MTLWERGALKGSRFSFSVTPVTPPLAASPMFALAWT